ncbi:hypothetical protein CUJ84_pRLN3000026 (plasmid) [Rhizobium leguminosarum]|uniref:Uncharacterized protein n=1 Tax=Rhizobium leguminosarum TaxID=384 RepID=A0A2K9ZG20_RHILE|nr:hypothetical protein CUJ84_pRLN3000026 [Rhizobium leguminosarum]
MSVGRVSPLVELDSDVLIDGIELVRHHVVDAGRGSWWSRTSLNAVVSGLPPSTTPQRL